MKNSRALQPVLILVLVVATGCGDTTGDPQPIPIPGPRRDLLRNTGGKEDQDVSIRVLGLPDSMKGAVEVTVENLRVHEQVTVVSTETGSFSTAIGARLDDLLRIGVKNGTETVELKVPKDPTLTSVIIPPEPIAGVLPITVNGDGTITLQGLVSANDPVVAFNASSGAVKRAVAGADGRFSMRLPAKPKDTIIAYRDATTLAAPWELSVP